LKLVKPFLAKSGIPPKFINHIALLNIQSNTNLINHQLQLVAKINKRNIVTSVTLPYI